MGDDPRSGRPSPSQIEENVTYVRELLNVDRRISIRLLSDTLNISKPFINRIFEEKLCMRKVYAKLLMDEQKSNKVFIASVSLCS